MRLALGLRDLPRPPERGDRVQQGEEDPRQRR